MPFAEPFFFDEYAGSSRDLICAPKRTQKLLYLAPDIAAITYLVNHFPQGGAPQEPGQMGNVPLSAMLATPVEWHRDKLGYSFIWTAPGTLWPTPGQQYRLILTFTTSVALGGKPFIKTWHVTTFDPTQPMP